MSTEIDMKDYAGELVPAAGEQQVDTNSYLQEASYEEFPVQQELLPQPDVKSEVDVAPSKQELNFQALREEVDRIKAERESERREHQLQLDMMRVNLSQQQPQKQEPERRMFEGMNDEDIPSVKDLRTEWEQREVVYQSRIEELQVAQQHPDYAEVIEKYAKPLVQQKPYLAEGLLGAKNKALFAYELGKMAQQIQAQQTPPPAPVVNQAAQRMVENSRKPGTLAQAGGQSVLSKADYYATMSDQEFYQMAQKHMDEV